MQEYIFCLTIGLAFSESPEQSPIDLRVAKFSTNPSLQRQDEVVVHWQIGLYGVDKPATFTAVVVNIVNELIPGTAKGEEDIFRKLFYLEIPDKEDLPRIRDILIRFNGGKLVLPSTVKTEDTN